MTDRVATTPGLYPLPGWAKPTPPDPTDRRQSGAGRKAQGGAEREARRTSLAETYDRIRAGFLEDQLDAGLDRVVEGQPRWHDAIASPLTAHDGVEAGEPVRYYDTDRSYRPPRVVDDLDVSAGSAVVAPELAAAAEVLDREAPLQATLPGPYSLSTLATDEHYGDDAALLEAVAAFLAGEVDACPDHETLFLLEPALVECPPGDGEDERASEAIDAVAGAADADVVVHTYGGAIPEKPYVYLLDADVDAVGLDLVAADRDATVYNVQEYGTTGSVALGVVDGRNAVAEDPATIRRRVEWFESQVPVSAFETTYVTANAELFSLPAEAYAEKLAALGASTERGRWRSS